MMTLLVSRLRYLSLSNKNICRSIFTESSVAAEPKPFKDIPGPPSIPLLGASLNFIPPFGKLANIVGDELNEVLHRKYGAIVRIDGSALVPGIVLLFDPDSISQVLRGENLTPVRPGFQSLTHFRAEQRKEAEGASTLAKGTTGLLTDHGDKWKEMRLMVNPVLLQPKTVKLYKDVIDDVAKDFMMRLKNLRNEKNMIQTNLYGEMNKWALESIAVVALGGRIGCLDPDLPEDSPAHQLIRNVHAVFHYANELDFKPSLWRFYATKTYKSAMEVYERQISLGKYFIKKAKEEIEKRKSVKHEKGVLEKLLEIDENVAVMMASDMLFAGVDTTANTMLATIYLLAINPEKQEKLREQIQSGDEKYLKAVIKESLRMMPVVSGNIRLTNKEYILNGYVVPKNQNVVLCHQFLALKDQQYPKAKEFIPERWLADKADPLYYGKAHPFAMSPFGFGTRQCIGKRIAQLEFESFLTQFIKTFKAEWNGPPVTIRQQALNYIDGPFNCVFRDL